MRVFKVSLRTLIESLIPWVEERTDNWDFKITSGDPAYGVRETVYFLFKIHDDDVAVEMRLRWGEEVTLVDNDDYDKPDYIAMLG